MTALEACGLLNHERTNTCEKSRGHTGAHAANAENLLWVYLDEADLAAAQTATSQRTPTNLPKHETPGLERLYPDPADRLWEHFKGHQPMRTADLYAVLIELQQLRGQA